MKETQKTIINFAWRFFERCGSQSVSMIVSLILARLLDPALYGNVALITVFTAILQVFIDSGLGNALIQKKSADSLDFSSVFYFNVFSSIFLYALMYILAPLIAKLFQNPELVLLIRVISLTLIISGVKGVQQAYVSRHMLFKRFFFATLGGTVGAAVIGIAMAYGGYGVWALVAQMLFNQTVDTLVLWMTVGWHPTREFSFLRLQSLLSFGWKLLVTSLLDTIYGKLRHLIIGVKYTDKNLAFFSKGDQYAYSFVYTINTSIDSVLLPTMANEQDNQERVKSMTRRAIKTSSYLMWPLMVGQIACAVPLIRLIITDKWLPCVPYMRIFCLTYAFSPIQTANLNAMKALGRSDLFLKLEILKKIVGLTAIAISMWFGVIWMAYSMIIISFLSQAINAWPNRKLLHYKYGEQLLDILPSILLSTVMGGIVYMVTFLNLPDLPTLLIQIPLGAVIYIAGSQLFHLESYTYILGMLKGYLHKKERKKEA